MVDDHQRAAGFQRREQRRARLVARAFGKGLQIEVVEILHRDDRVERFGKGGRGERPRDGIDILISGIDRGLIVAILLLERDELGGLEAINLARWTHRGRKQARDITAAHHEIADLFPRRDFRSEEHTSELQSLMRNSYAVFCLKKKKQ